MASAESQASQRSAMWPVVCLLATLASGPLACRCGATPDEAAPQVVHVGTGDQKACAVVKDGLVYCWGRTNQAGLMGSTKGASRDYHELYSKDYSYFKRPRRVPKITGAKRVAVGHEHACAIVDGGAVVCWGSNEEFQCNPGVASLRDIIWIDAARHHTCAISKGGAVWCWGEVGRLLTLMVKPTRVPGLPAAAQVDVGGTHHACARTRDGAVWCWGDNHIGVLGRPRVDGDATHEQPAGVVAGLADVVDIAVGETEACAVRANGSVWCWGEGSRARAGRPTKVAGISDAVEVVLAHRFAFVRRKDGTVLHWSRKTKVEPIPNLSGVAAMSAYGFSGTHLCARAGAAVHCWGEGAFGALGNDDTADVVSAPVTPRW